MITLGLVAQAYVVAHLADAPGTLGHLVARALQPVLAYVPAGCLVTVDDVEINGHMVGLFVQRALFPPPYNEPPWGQAGKVPSDVVLPPAVYLDGTYLSVDVPCAPSCANRYAQLADKLPEPIEAVENVVNVATIPWADTTHPSNDFVATRLFVDVRAFAAPGTRDWLQPALRVVRTSQLAPVWLSCDRARPGTYGLRLRDLCLQGGQRLALLPGVVPPKRWDDMLRLLAWRHPPVPIEMRRAPDTCCKLLSSRGNVPVPPALVLPVLVRAQSLTPDLLRRLQRKVDACSGQAPCALWLVQGTLNNVSGGIAMMTIVMG